MTRFYAPRGHSLPGTGFLEEIAAKLNGQPIGDGLVFRAIREAQARFLTPRATRDGSR